MNTVLLSSKSQIASLEKAVSTVFSSVGITEEVLYSGPIVHTGLIWQNPPLKPEGAYIGNVPLLEYYSVSMNIQFAELVKFYENTLRLLKTSPETLFYRGDFAGIRAVFGKTYIGQRAFRFSTPDGYPATIDDYSALVFALEAVDLAVNALPVESYQDDSNYWASVEGITIGIRDGKILGSAHWPADYSGMVSEFLAMPRGLATTACNYDTIAKVRSVLWENKGLFSRNFLGLDYALQMLRSLDKHNLVGNILKTSKVVRSKPVVPDHDKLAAVERCIATMRLTNLSDKSKITRLHYELVPIVMGAGTFNREVYNVYGRVPYTLSDKVIDRINTKLAELKAESICRLAEQASSKQT